MQVKQFDLVFDSKETYRVMQVDERLGLLTLQPQRYREVKGDYVPVGKAKVISIKSVDFRLLTKVRYENEKRKN